MNIDVTSHISDALRSLQVQFIDYPGGVLLRRGGTTVKLGTKGAAKAVRIILEETQNEGRTVEQICNLFSPKVKSLVKNLINQLVGWNLLVRHDSHMFTGEAVDGNLQVFYWDLHSGFTQAVPSLAERRITILGLNQVSRQIAGALNKAGLKQLKIVDLPLLRNLSFFDKSHTFLNQSWPDETRNYIATSEKFDPKDTDCVVITSDFGSNSSFHEVNALCVSSKCHLLPVILQNVSGSVGPLIIPEETACFECLRARHNSHIDDWALWQACEDAAFDGQQSFGLHPAMPAILGNIAAFELTKLYGGLEDLAKVGTLIEFNLRELRLTQRKVLKVPRCRVCSRMKLQASTNPEKTFFVPLDWDSGERK
ncbi:MAG: hypothetical protein K0S45_3572 [Nitrospira sp.]|jgi:bacteriocin biosynthesis cyclodehydratase domain-containing protein|nr:hypothetical protein [Nitrospira sp.]